VIVRGERLELSNGTSVIATIPKRDDEYDLETLSNMVMSLKRDHPNDDDASVLLEPNIEYDHLIQVMDAVRSVELPQVDDEEIIRVALFTDISIGDAP
jgi:biopolymer transport protein ExbD